MIARRRQDCPLLDNSQNPGLCNIDNCNGDRDCQCSDISYLLFAACHTCIGDWDPSWGDYSRSFHCPNSAAPTPLPSAVPTNAIPSWAIAMASQTPSPTTFDPQAATSLASFINSASTFPPAFSAVTNTANANASSTPFNLTSSSLLTSSLTSSNPSETSTSSTVSPLSGASEKNTSNAGAIAGGLIGALVFLALLVAGLLYFRRRRRQAHIAPSAAYMAALRAGEQPYHPVQHRDSMDEMRSVEQPERQASPWPSSSDSLRNESRFLEHT